MKLIKFKRMVSNANIFTHFMENMAQFMNWVAITHYNIDIVTNMITIDYLDYEGVEKSNTFKINVIKDSYEKWIETVNEYETTDRTGIYECFKGV